MGADLWNLIKAYKICAFAKPPLNVPNIQLASSIATRPLKKIYIDFLVNLPRTKDGNTYPL